jgi:protein tyrosine phosphatase
MFYLLISNLLVASYSTLKSFNCQRLKYIDNYNGNYLFRSGSPLTSDLKNFDIDNITCAMKEQLIQYNMSLIEPFYLIDISLLTQLKNSDKFCLKIEYDFFRNNSRKGIVINYPIFGEPTPPYHMRNCTHRNILATTINQWTNDKLPSLILYIRTILEMKMMTPLVILVHCMEGVDRTGEVIGSYQLRYLNTTVCNIIQQDTFINNNSIAPKRDNYNALLWYQLYLSLQNL